MVRRFLLTIALLSWGCETHSQIYTAGSFKALPREGTKIVVQGNVRTGREMAERWLQDRGLIVLHRTDPVDSSVLCKTCNEEQAALAKTLFQGAEQAVTVQSSRLRDPDRIVVFVQSLSVRTQEELWNSTAWEQFPEGLSGEEAEAKIALLTCHALATVWRYRPAGYPTNTSRDLCNIHL
jgi:hypothetical protein